MITKILSIAKFVIFIAILLISLMACERNFKDIGIALVDNNKFNTNHLISPVIAYSKKIDSVRTDSLPQYVLGININNTFGKTTAAIASQLALPLNGTDFGVNPTIDSVILDLPYYSTKTGTEKVPNPSNTNDTIVVPTFKLDSIIGDKSKSFQIQVSELGTFLNTLDPNDPTKRKLYYSNKNYKTIGPPLYSGLFTPNANDTATFIKYKDLNGNVFDRDTIKRTGSIPSIKLPLDESFFQNNFIAQSKSEAFSTLDAFSHYFRGLYISASGNDGSLITMPIANASITIFYSNDVTSVDSSNVSTTKRTKQKMIFPFGSIKTNKFEHDYSFATSPIQSKLLNPDIINGEDKLYVQGASGSLTVLKLFPNGTLDSIRAKNWLINEASLTLYIDKDLSGSNIPERLFIYNFDDNSQLKDIISEGATVLDGTLHYDDNGNPSFYKFRFTDHMAQVLKSDNPTKLSKLAIKSFSPLDIPSFLRLSDTIVKPFNWNPKGVVLYGNKELSNKKLSLDIYYTELKN